MNLLLLLISFCCLQVKLPGATVPKGLTPMLDPSDPFADDDKERREVEELARKFESKYVSVALKMFWSRQTMWCAVILKTVINPLAVVVFRGKALICRSLLVVAQCSCMTTLFAGWCRKEEEEGQDSGPCWYWLWLRWDRPVYWQLRGRKFLSSRIRFLE